MDDRRYSPVVVLDGSHDRRLFDCGAPALNVYLRKFALQNQEKGIVRNYVVTPTGSAPIAGFYSLVYGAIAGKQLPAGVVKGLGRYDVPLMLLARLAVDLREQGKGLGKALLKDAVLRTMQAAQIAGLKLLLVHAKDGMAADFCRKHGFVSVEDDPFKLFLPVPISR
jgi:GNAT superfamily N-acetyltransferase